jgi:hypothetical protein
MMYLHGADVSSVLVAVLLSDLLCISTLVRACAPSPVYACSWDHHTEFAVGLDWSMLAEGLLASAGWDQQVVIWHQAE